MTQFSADWQPPSNFSLITSPQQPAPLSSACLTANFIDGTIVEITGKLASSIFYSNLI